MAGGYKVGIASETKAFKAGVEAGIIEPLEDANKELKKLGDSKGAAGLEADLKGAQRVTEKLEDSIKDTGRQLERMGRQGKEAGDDVKKGLKGGFDEAKNEAGQSGREAAASFSGGFEDVGDFVQETIANGLAGFGPAGAAVGIALAAVIGTVLSNAQAAQEKLEEARSKAAELATSMYENGGDLPLTDRVSDLIEMLTSEQLASNPLENLANGFVDLGTNLDMVKDAAKSLDQPLSNVITALTGSDLKSTEKVLAAARKELEKINEESGNTDTASWQERKDNVTGLITELEKTVSTLQLADEVGKSVEFLNAQAVEEQAERIKSATEAVAESASTAYDTMRDSAYEKATADNAAFNIDAWLAYVAESRVQADNYRTNIQSMQLTPGEWENLLSMPEEARSAIVNSYATSGTEGKAKIREALGDGGAGEAGGEATVAFDDAFTPKADVKPTVDTSAAEAKIAELTKEREIKVKVKLDKSDWEDWNPKKTGSVVASVDKSAWNDWTPGKKYGTVQTQRRDV